MAISLLTQSEAVPGGCFLLLEVHHMDISNLNIDDLVTLRDEVSIRLQSLVKARQDRLRAEVEKLASLTGQGPAKVSKRVMYRKGEDGWSGTDPIRPGPWL